MGLVKKVAKLRLRPSTRVGFFAEMSNDIVVNVAVSNGAAISIVAVKMG